LHLDILGAVVLDAEQTFLKFLRDRSPSEHVLDGIAQLPSRLPQAPD